MNTEPTFTLDQYESDEQVRICDVQLPSIVNKIFLVVWISCVTAGLILIIRNKDTFFGLLVIGIPTFLAMIMKPTFGLCMVMLALPTGAGIGVENMFSLDRGVGIGLALSFMLNIILTRPILKFRNSFQTLQIAFVLWIIVNIARAPVLTFDALLAFTQIQLLVLSLIVYWIIQNSRPSTFIWTLRSYVVGAIGSALIAKMSGASTTNYEDERFVGAGQFGIDSNMMAALLVLAIFSAIYLLVRDRSLLWRLFYIGALMLLPLMVLQTGSRGALLAAIAAIGSPLLFVGQMLRRPVLYLALILGAAILVGSVWFGRGLYRIDEAVLARYTDVSYAHESLEYRKSLINIALDTFSSHPFGVTFSGWFEQNVRHIVHSDFFHILATCGIPGALLLLSIFLSIALGIYHTPLGIEKIFARTIFIFLLINGMNILQCFDKFFWVFLVIVYSCRHMSEYYTNPNVNSASSKEVGSDPAPTLGIQNS